MKIRLQTRPAVLFGAMIVVALIIFLPMRLMLSLVGLGEYGLSARTVLGSVWYARLNEVHVGDLNLGDLNARLSPWQLLIGRARIDLIGAPHDDKPGLHGAISTSRHRFGIEDMTAAVPSGSVFAPLPVAGLELENVSIAFENGACVIAEGRVKALLSGGIAGIPLSQGMTGDAKCDAGALLLPLVSLAGTETVTVRIKGDGQYRATLAIQPSDPILGQRLAQAGFQANAAGYALSVEGHF